MKNSIVVVAYDATKDHNEHELQVSVNEILLRGDILVTGDSLIVLGVLHSIPNPMGYQTKVCSESIFGTNPRAIEDEVSKKVDMFANMLFPSAQQCKDRKVSINVKVTAGMPIKKVILQEVVACEATWLIIDRQLRRDLKFYLRQIPCKVALIQDSLTVQVMRPYTTTNADLSEYTFFYSLCKPVKLQMDLQDSANNDPFITSSGSYSACSRAQDRSNNSKCSLVSSSSNNSKGSSFLVSDASVCSSKQINLDKHATGDNGYSRWSPGFSKQLSSEAPVLCAGCGMRTALYIKEAMNFEFSEIQVATSDFSKEHLLGEGGYGHVYKGSLIDGRVIAAKVRKEGSIQGSIEFCSEVYVLSFARHKNIVMLLGYCSSENHKILVYEYICNKSLEWHLFSKSAVVLEWHKRRAIAIGTGKGLRFLHEECRGSPIIHRDLRPSNILLTHDFVPMLGDFGLAKWKIGDESTHTGVMGTLGYLAPEYAENGFVSVRTDVYAFGIVLLQLISGRKVVEERKGQQQFLLQWAEPLIEQLALHELIDPSIGESYDTYELYNMARAAYLCVRRSPEMRPSMTEVIYLLEGEHGHVHHLAEQFIPHYTQ